jgi:hypothetical protein
MALLRQPPYAYQSATQQPKLLRNVLFIYDWLNWTQNRKAERRRKSSRLGCVFNWTIKVLT